MLECGVLEKALEAERSGQRKTNKNLGKIKRAWEEVWQRSVLWQSEQSWDLGTGERGGREANWGAGNQFTAAFKAGWSLAGLKVHSLGG